MSVTSRDGTTIGFRQLGSGPGLVLMHGGALASQHYMRLATALADAFTVYVPDRRGRGRSGDHGPDYGIAREDEDLAAVIDRTGARYVFGTADGGLFALHASMVIPAIQKIAVFEPVLFVGQPGIDAFRQMIERAERQIASGDLGAAMATLAVGAAAGDPRTQQISAPYRLLGAVFERPAMCRMLLWADARRTKGGDVALRYLIPTLVPELHEVMGTEGTIDDYRNVTAEVLLLCGSGAPPLFTATRDALAGVLLHSARVELPGLNHGAAQDRGGDPTAIAVQLRQFFGGAG